MKYRGLQFSPNGSRVLYLADQDTDDVNEIYTRVVHQNWNVASGQWDGPANWDQGEAPDEVMSINIHPESFATVTGPAIDLVARLKQVVPPPHAVLDAAW